MNRKELQATLEATQQQLRKLERATKTLEPYLLAGELTADYLHVENNTLSILAMELTLILKQLDSDERNQRNLPEMIRRVVDIVDTMQIRHSQMWLMIRGRESEVPLSESIQDSIRLISRRVDRQRVAVTTRISPEAGALKVPAHSYRTILINLLKDCLGAFTTRKGRIFIEASVDSEMLILAVKDNSPRGEPDPTVEIWSPEVASYDPGLGLWFVRETVKDLGGTITFESSPLGAKFVITAPIGPGKQANEKDSLDRRQ